MFINVHKDIDVHAQLAQISGWVNDITQDETLRSQVNIVSSELLYNIIKFAPSGQINFYRDASSIYIEAQDIGKGFSSLMEHVLQEGLSTAGSLGLGIPSIIRLCDDVWVETSESGTFYRCSWEV